VKIHAVRLVLYPEPLLIATLYPPSSRLLIAELMTPVSLFIKKVNPFVASLQLYQVKLNGPVPPGLTALRLPLTLPEELQKMNTWSFTPGADGYEVYLTAFIPGAVSWPRMFTDNNKAEMKNQKRTGYLFFKDMPRHVRVLTITVSIFLWYNHLQV